MSDDNITLEERFTKLEEIVKKITTISLKKNKTLNEEQKKKILFDNITFSFLLVSLYFGSFIKKLA